MRPSPGSFSGRSPWTRRASQSVGTLARSGHSAATLREPDLHRPGLASAPKLEAPRNSRRSPRLGLVPGAAKPKRVVDGPAWRQRHGFGVREHFDGRWPRKIGRSARAILELDVGIERVGGPRHHSPCEREGDDGVRSRVEERRIQRHRVHVDDCRDVDVQGRRWLPALLRACVGRSKSNTRRRMNFVTGGALTGGLSGGRRVDHLGSHGRRGGSVRVAPGHERDEGPDSSANVWARRNAPPLLQSNSIQSAIAKLIAAATPIRPGSATGTPPIFQLTMKARREAQTTP